EGQDVRISRSLVGPRPNPTFRASVPPSGGSGDAPANSFLTRRRGGGSPKVKEQHVGRSPRPTTLPTCANEPVAGPLAFRVGAVDPSPQTTRESTNLTAERGSCLSYLSRDVRNGRIRVDSRHLGVPRAFR